MPPICLEHRQPVIENEHDPLQKDEEEQAV
jgi:hypothetical protein